MKKTRIAKITLNIGAGKNEDQLKKGLKLLEKITGRAPVKTLAKKRNPTWGLRPGLQIGCKITVRKNTKVLLKRLLVAKENKLSLKNFDTQGNFAFGIAEYIDIEGLEYDPDLKILGLEAAVTLERPGYRVKRRKLKPGKIGHGHALTKQDALDFVQQLGVVVE